jgi:hypothetical protein
MSEKPEENSAQSSGSSKPKIESDEKNEQSPPDEGSYYYDDAHGYEKYDPKKDKDDR